MNKQAYFKLMGLNKKAEDDSLFGPTVTAEGNRQKARQVAQKQTQAKAQRSSKLRTQRDARTAGVNKAIAENKARQAQLRQQEAQAKKQREAKQRAEREQIRKGVQAAEAKYKQEQADDRAAVAKQRAWQEQWKKQRKLVAQFNALKDREAKLKYLSKTPTQLAQARIAEQKFNNAKRRVAAPLDTALAFSKGTGEYNAKKQLGQALAPKNDPMKLLRQGATNKFLAGAKKNLSAPLDTAISGNNAVANTLKDPLALAGDPNKIRSDIGHKMIQQKIDQLGAKNKELAAKLGIPAGTDPMAFGNKMLDEQGRQAKNFYNMFYPKNSIETGMKRVNQDAANALEADAVRKGLGNVFMFDRFNSGKMSDAAKAALGQNIRKYTTYKDKGWWERLLAWLRQMWAGVSGGNPLSTERGAAMQAGERAGNIWSGLSDKIQKGLLQGK